VKGIVFNLLEEVVSKQYGEDVWDQLLDDAAADGVYTSLGSYPDGQLSGLVTAASKRLGLSADEVLRWFGQSAIGLLAGRYPQFFEAHVSTRAFVLTLNDIIHPEVRKIYPGAEVPEFTFDASSSSTLLIEYRSARRLCSFAVGMIEGAARHYGEEARVIEIACARDGSPACTFRATFAAQAQVA
jgi:predicted hydrocarbon binding protein